MRIHLSTLGCKLNESELEAWARRFARDGHEIVNDVRAADVIVLNTCTVTHIAARKTRQLARQFARANPQARLVLTGCFVSISPNEAKALPNVALVVPNATKDQLVEQIASGEWRMAQAQSAIGDQPSAISGQPAATSQQWLDADVETQVAGRQALVSDPVPHLRTRAFVKIQDGCNLSCAYCIIPRARGEERSRPPEEIVTEVNALVSLGYKEIILTGVQISAYRGTNRQFALRDLIAAILAETDVPRLRLTSIAPWEVEEPLLDLWSDPRVCRHLHLSLQSGSDSVLRQMRRPYTTAQFARAVELVRTLIPDVGITTDVIVGFPGESDVEFEQSLQFVEQMQFARVHVFPYSKREGTAAAALPMQISDAVKQSRAQQMQAVAETSLRAFARRFVGRAVKVLWETCEDGRAVEEQGSRGEFSLLPSSARTSLRRWSGYTDNYIRAVTASEADLVNQFTTVRVTNVTADGVAAE